MENDNKVVGKIKTPITHFTDKISSGFRKAHEEDGELSLGEGTSTRGPKNNEHWLLEILGADCGRGGSYPSL